MAKVKTAPPPAQRGSADIWLDAAYRLLITSGVDSVRIVPLAEQLGLSRTSFYWFFEDRQALLDALLERWRTQNTGSLIRQTRLYADSITEGIFNVFDCWLDSRIFDSNLEFAVRSWAQQSADVAADIQRADEARLAALAEMFIRFRFDPDSADVRARTIYLTQIGYISMRVVEDLETRMRRIPAYVEIFTGVPPAARELDRFHARHPSDMHDASPAERTLAKPPRSRAPA